MVIWKFDIFANTLDRRRRLLNSLTHHEQLNISLDWRIFSFNCCNYSELETKAVIKSSYDECVWKRNVWFFFVSNLLRNVDFCAKFCVIWLERVHIPLKSWIFAYKHSELCFGKRLFFVPLPWRKYNFYSTWTFSKHRLIEYISHAVDMRSVHIFIGCLMCYDVCVSVLPITDATRICPGGTGNDFIEIRRSGKHRHYRITFWLICMPFSLACSLFTCCLFPFVFGFCIWNNKVFAKSPHWLAQQATLFDQSSSNCWAIRAGLERLINIYFTWTFPSLANFGVEIQRITIRRWVWKLLRVKINTRNSHNWTVMKFWSCKTGTKSNHIFQTSRVNIKV